METPALRKADIIAAIGFLGASVLMAFVVIPWQTAEGQWYGLSPMAFPLVLMGGIALASLGLLLQALMQRSKYDDIEPPLTWMQLRNFAIAALIILVGALAVEHLGFWFGAPALIAGCMLYMGEAHPLRVIPTAVLPPLVVFLLARYVLGTPLP
jgi:hypothetical protein